MAYIKKHKYRYIPAVQVLLVSARSIDKPDELFHVVESKWTGKKLHFFIRGKIKDEPITVYKPNGRFKHLDLWVYWTDNEVAEVAFKKRIKKLVKQI